MVFSWPRVKGIITLFKRWIILLLSPSSIKLIRIDTPLLQFFIRFVLSLTRIRKLRFKIHTVKLIE